MSRPASSPLEILAVEMAPRAESLRGAHLGLPKAGETAEARGLLLRGWALGEEEAVLAVEILHGERVVARAPVSLPRPDIAGNYADLEHAGRSGFERTLNLAGARGELELSVRAVLDPLRRAPLATVALRAPTAAPGSAGVAVVIPCFDQAHFLAEAIESALAQSLPPAEVLVVDDGSRDNTGEVAAAYPGVRCMRQPNSGLAAARNAGLDQVEADLVLFLDADDRLLPTAIESGIRVLQAEPDAVMAAGAWRPIGEDGRPLPAAQAEPPADVYPALLESCFISSPAAVLYRRSLFAEIGGFDPTVSASADYDLYLRAAAGRRVALHREVVAEYRRHGANMTRDAELIMRSELEVLRRQRSLVRRRPALRAALARGMRRSRSYHGERMVDDIRRKAEQGRREEALRGVAALARLHPGGAPDALRALRRRGAR